MVIFCWKTVFKNFDFLYRKISKNVFSISHAGRPKPLVVHLNERSELTLELLNYFVVIYINKTSSSVDIVRLIVWSIGVSLKSKTKFQVEPKVGLSWKRAYFKRGPIFNLP